MADENIVIQKLTLEVTVNASGATNESDWLYLLREWLDGEFLPKLEDGLLHALPNNGQTLRLERLELDLGQFSQQRFEKMAVAELPRLLADALEQGEVEASKDVPQRRVAPQEKELEALVYFLQNGRLPWWKSPTPSSVDEWERQLLEVMRTGGVALGKLVTALRKKAARQRLASEFSGQFLQQLVVSILAKRKTEPVGNQDFVLDFLKKSASQKTGKTATAKPDWEAVFEQILGAIEPFIPEGKTATNEELQPVLRQTSEVDSEPIYIRNAGLVLLHPFLQMLLEELGLAQKGEVSKPERAVQVMHLLSVGRVGAEWELPLNKLLCGLPPEAVVSSKIRLTNRERAECQRLLEAAIRHWSVLGETSPAGLQGTFLSREGKLTRKPDGDWLLQVEQRGFDVLLADLPWGISMVKLPWMPDSLWVEWG